MPTPVVEVAEAVREAVADARSITVLRRYTPFYEASEVVDGKWFVMAQSEAVTQKKWVQSSVIEVTLAYQRALPDSSGTYEDPLTNLPFLDGCMAEVEATKELFREDGSLNDFDMAGCTLIGIENEPIYRADFLLDHQIFTSTIKLTYRTGAS